MTYVTPAAVEFGGGSDCARVRPGWGAAWRSRSASRQPRTRPGSTTTRSGTSTALPSLVPTHHARHACRCLLLRHPARGGERGIDPGGGPATARPRSGLRPGTWPRPHRRGPQGDPRPQTRLINPINRGGRRSAHWCSSPRVR